MIKIYTRISNFKNKNGKSDNPDFTKPTHIVQVATQEDYNDKEFAGDLWTKITPNSTFTSGSLKNGRSYKNDNGEEVKDGEFVILNVGVEKAKKILQVYEDYLITQRNPEYPTPTKMGLDPSKVMVPDPAFPTAEDLDIDPRDIPFD